MNTKPLQYLSVALILISVILSGTSLIPKMDWARFERTSGIASIDYTLSADFDAMGFEYSIETQSSSGGGGLIGGIGGGIGSNSSLGDDWKTYPEVKGKVLENLGVLYDSYKEKSFEYELLMREPPENVNISWSGSGSPSAILNVSLRADLVPYWPEESSRPLVVTITFLGTEIDDQLSQIELENIEVLLKEVNIKVKTGYNKNTGEYEGEIKNLKKIEPNEVFKQNGDKYSKTIEVSIPKGENAVGFIVDIKASLTDPWGRSERAPLSGKANSINVRAVGSMNLLKGAGIAFALPVILLGMIFGIAAIILILVRKKSCPGLVVPASILTMIGPFWYRSGMNAAVEMLGERLAGAENGLEWAPGLFIAFAGAGFMLIAMIVSIISLVFEIKNKENVSESEKDPSDSGSSIKEPVFQKIPDQKNNDTTGSKTATSHQFKQVGNEQKEELNSPPPPPLDPFN